MKKTLLYCWLLALFATTYIYSQAFTENFNDITTLSGSGWATQNSSVAVGSTSWFQGNPTGAGGPFDSFNGATNSYIAANYNNTGNVGTISNWLMTPNRTFRNGDVITFYTRKASPDTYADRLEVRLSTNGASTNTGSGSGVGDYTSLLLSVNPSLTLGVYPTTWTQYTVIISGLSAPISGRVAFRYFVTSAGLSGTNSDYIGIDAVNYTPYVCPVLTVSAPAGGLTNSNEGAPYSKQFSQTGALGTPTYNVTAGALPPGMTLSASGLLSGAATASGTFNFTVTVNDNSGCSVSQAFSITINPCTVALTPASQTNIACNGGSTGAATVNAATGGTGPYTYNWTPGNPTGDGTTSVTGLTAGTWTVTVTDANGCTATQAFTITQPAAVLNATAGAQTNISCNGGTNGSATVAVTGGTPGYTYSWAPSGGTAATATGLSVGTYTVTVTDANGCTDTQSFTITQATGAEIVWGSGSSDTAENLNGRFANAFNGAGSWQAVSISDGNATPGNALWVRSTTGTSNGAYWSNLPAMASPSQTDGVALFDSDFMDNGGIQGAFGTGSSPSPQNGQLISPSFDLSPYSGQELYIDFYLYYRNFQINQLLLSYSNDGGASWTDVNIQQPGVGANQIFQTGMLTYPLTGLTNVSDLSSCKIRFTFNGDYYFAMVDDVTIRTNGAEALSADVVSQTNITCNGGATGAITVIGTGGTAPYTYIWNNGATTASVTGLTAGTWTVTVTDANGCTATQSFTLTQPPALSLTPASQTNIACNGGSTGAAAVNAATGGTGPYTYNWTPGNPTGDGTTSVTGLTAGTWTVTVTDANGCTATQSFTLTQPPALSLTPASQTNIACNGGSTGAATVNAATGGTGPYTYNWTPGNPTGDGTTSVTGLAAGTWTVTATDANGCTATQSFTITQPPALSLTPASQTNIACNGGSTGAATVNAATGGTGPYTYNWTPGNPTGDGTTSVTGLAAGTWTVTVTDANGCTATQAFTITQPAVLNATAGAQTNVSCNGGTNGSATVAVTGGTPGYTYSWAPSGGTAATATGLAAGTYTVTVTDANGCTDTQAFTITQPTVLNATAGAQTNVSCNGGTNGSATVAVTGGTPGYTYSWAPSGGTAATATGLAAGTYTVTVTDANGCTDTQAFTITQPTVLNATAGAQTNVSCNGGTNGSATVAVTGGTPGYTYSWAPSGGTAATATGLAAGTYTVTVTDANGCTDTQAFTITQPTVLNATAGAQTNVSCNGGTNGSATVAVTGGTPGYTYSWAPSGGTAATATGLAAGTYTVTVTDANGCTDTQSFTITQPAVLNATAGSQTNVSCNGGTNGSATVAVTGGTPGYTYSWAPSGGTAATATGLAAGTYTVTVTDANGCTDTQSFTITQPTVLNATAGAQTNVSCNGGTNGSATVAVTGGTPGYTYSWAPSGGTAATATGLAAGTYTVTVTDANGCTDTQAFTITQPLTLVASAVQDFPATCVENSDGGATVTVAGGTLPYTYAWDNSEATASATALTVGNHTVTVTDANGCTATANVTISFSDTVAPVPTVANLPNITAQCSVTEADVPVPTATDECAGTIVVTHNATFPITAQGTTVITWTYEDVNGNTTTQTQNVVIDDTSAPVPTIANLPVITMQCQVLTTDIPVPTANDNCAGALVATTTDPLLYTALGTYTITWSYDDGNNNITTQTQTVVVTESAINAVTFTNQTVVYNTAAQAITVDNLPTGATVAYSISPDTGLGNAAINAGTYTVTALVSPAPNAPNCDPITLSATLTIEQAPQVITFAPIPVKNLEADPDFQLTATASSGLPVYYTYTFTAPTAPATVTSGGWVDMLTSGIVQITAHQDGNANYLPATPVMQELVINSSDASIHTITIGDTEYINPGQDIYHLILCEDTASSVTVNLVTEVNATVVPGHTFVIQTPQPGIYTQTVTITSQDGTVTQTFTVTVEKMFQFFDIAVQKFDNVLLANNNPSTNGGYSFTAYEWYKNGVLVSRDQYFSEGPTNDDLLDPNAEYYLRLTTVEGDVLQTCIGQVTLEHSFRISVFPNPAVTGSEITVTADFPGREFNDMRIDIHDINGRLVHSGQTNQRVTQIQLGTGIEAGVYMVSCTTDKHRESFKIIVRK